MNTFAKGRAARLRDTDVLISPRAREAFYFISLFFSSWDKVCLLVQNFGPSAGPQWEGFVDASPENGVGGCLYHVESKIVYLLFHPFSRGEIAEIRVLCPKPKHGAEPKFVNSSGIAESKGIAAFVRITAALCARQRVHLGADAMAAIAAFRQAFSPVTQMLEPLRRARLSLGHYHVRLHIYHLVRARNLIADHISKRAFQKGECEARRLFGHHCKIVWLTHH
jgi:hypothetical protein